MKRCAALTLAGLTSAAALGRGPEQPPLRSGLDLSTLDRSVRPQDDLYRYVNGRWIERSAIPEDRVSYGAFVELADRADEDVRRIIEELAAEPQRRGSPEQQIADLYGSMLNEARIEALGAAPIRAELDRIDKIADAEDFAAEAGRLSAIGAGGPFAGTVTLDAANRLALQISQGGTLLPHPSDYEGTTSKPSEVRDGYVAYLERVFTLSDRPSPRADADRVVALEAAIAKAYVADADRDGAGSKTFTPDRLHSAMPGFDWRSWARPQGLESDHSVIVVQPAFFERFAALVPATPLESWKAWLAARYITASAPFLSAAFADARFQFFGRFLTGQETPRARWKRGVSLVNGYLGDAIGRLYVERHFPPRAMIRAELLTARIVSSYRRAIAEARWMNDGNRRTALARLATLRTRIGYPERWRSYAGLAIDRNDLLGNVQRAQKFENDLRVARLRRPPDSGEWLMTPQTVNAYYNPGANEVIVPAAILQPPLFDLDVDDAVNYGGMGALLGHEISHAVDTRDFDEPAGTLIDQFDAYRPLPDGAVNGRRTQAENLRDLGGLSLAYRAYTNSLDGREPPIIDGFTGPQRFFMGWAQMWRTSIRDEYLRQWLLTSPYAPPQFRTNGPASNLTEFYQAFGVGPGDKLYRDPAKRVRIW